MVGENTLKTLIFNNLMKFQKKMSILIEWNFFVSYHGFNPCDLASAFEEKSEKMNGISLPSF